jgi:hypothetical protein
MKSPFKIKHKFKFDNDYKWLKNQTILNEFEYRFNKSYADKIVFINDKGLLVKNEIIRFTPDLNFNFWSGIGKATVEIDGDENQTRTVTYTYYYTRIIIAYIIMICFFYFTLIFAKLSYDQTLRITLFVSSLLAILYLMTLLIIMIRHKTVFNKVIRYIKTGYNIGS